MTTTVVACSIHDGAVQLTLTTNRSEITDWNVANNSNRDARAVIQVTPVTVPPGQSSSSSMAPALGIIYSLEWSA